MKGKTLMSSIAAVAVLASLGFGQMSGRGMNRQKGHWLNTTNPATIEGTIVKVETLEKGTGRYGTGIHLVVTQGKQESDVHLGPKRYIESAGWAFKAGDKIKINAFNGTYNNTAALFASEITANGKTLVLRDKQGFPEWRAGNGNGRGRGRRGFNRNGRGACRRAY